MTTQKNSEHSFIKFKEFSARIGRINYPIYYKPTKHSSDFPSKEYPCNANSRASHFIVDYCGKKRRIYFSGLGQGRYPLHINHNGIRLHLEFVLNIK